MRSPRVLRWLESAMPGLAAYENEPQEGEGFWLAQPAPLSCRCVAAKLQQPSLVPVKLERKLLEPLPRVNPSYR